MTVTSLKYKTKLGTLAAPGDVDPGAMIPIATTVVGAGGSSTITFSSIPQNYEHLQLRLLSRSSGVDYGIIVKLNSDAGSNYYRHYLYADGSTIASGGDASAFSGALFLYSALSSGTANVYSANIVDVLDYANTNKYKTMRNLNGSDFNGSGFVSLSSALWNSTAAVNSITLTIYGGHNFVQYTHAALYGIKKAGA